MYITSGEVNMSFKTQIILRRIAKIILFFTGLGLALYGGYILYLSIVFRPYNVRISNITDSSFTVSWVTDSPMKGVVYYKETDSVLPGPLGWVSSESAVDDRDFAKAQGKCVEDFNSNAAEDMSDDFTVSGDNFDCENIEVKEYGKYYTHHVTLKNLDSEKEYFFKVGDGYLSWGLDSSRQVVDEDEYPTVTEFSMKTFSILDSVEEPNPAYGSVIGVVKEGENYREDDDVDALVFARLVSFDTDSESTLLSSVTNSSGGWYVDKSMVRQEDGSLHEYMIDDDFLYVGYQYRNYDDSKIMMLRLGYEDAPAPEIAGVTEEELKNMKEEGNWWEKIMGIFVKESKAVCIEGVGCSTYAEMMEQKAESGDRKAQAYVSSSNFEAQKSAQLKTMSDYAAGKVSKDDPNVIGYGNWLSQASSSCSEARNCTAVYEQAKDYGFTEEQISSKIDCGSVTCSSPLTLLEGGTGGGGGGDDDLLGLVSPEKGYFLASVENDGTITLSYEGTNIPNAEKYIDRIILKDIREANKDEKIYVSALRVDLVALIKSNHIEESNISSLLNEEQRIELKIPLMEREALAEMIINGKYLIESVLKGNEVENYSIKDGKVYYDGPLTQDWMNNWKESASEEDKDAFCQSFGLKDCQLFTVSESGTIGVLTYDSLVAESFASIPPVPISSETYSRMINIDPSVDNASLLKYSLNSADDARPLAEIFVKSSDENGFLAIGNVNYKFSDLVAEGSEFEGCFKDSGCSKEKAEKLVASIKRNNPEANLEIKNISGGKAILGYDPGYEYWAKYKDEQSSVLEVLGQESTNSSKGRSPFLIKLTSSAYANDSNENPYTYFLPEYGLFSLELGNYELTKSVSDGETIYLFYLEVNGIDGIQLPADPDDPQPSEDIVLKSNSYEISYEKKAVTKSFTLRKGINLISFDFIPVARDLSSFEASDFVYEAGQDNIEIQYVSVFEGGRWTNGWACKDSKCTGSNPIITPGKGYLIYSKNDGKVTIPGYTLKSSIPINFSTGWNLVGVHGYSKAFTARSFIDSINGVSGLTADNVSWWPTAKGKYEGLQVTDNKEYGLDFPISPTNGYFVRISKFKPTDTSCKSIIWHYGGTLNGTCGNSKTILN